MSVVVSIPAEPNPEQRCYISLSGRGISFDFEPALVAEAHAPSRTEIMAAAALVGIARALTGKGADAVIGAIAQFERQHKGGKR